MFLNLFQPFFPLGKNGLILYYCFSHKLFLHFLLHYKIYPIFYILMLSLILLLTNIQIHSHLYALYFQKLFHHILLFYSYQTSLLIFLNYYFLFSFDAFFWYSYFLLTLTSTFLKALYL